MRKHRMSNPWVTVLAIATVALAVACGGGKEGNGRDSRGPNDTSPTVAAPSDTASAPSSTKGSEPTRPAPTDAGGVGTLEVLASIDTDCAVAAVAVNPVTGRVYAVGPHCGLVVIDGATSTIVQTTGEPESWNSVAVNPTSNRIYVASTEPWVHGNLISVFDGATNTAVTTVYTDHPTGSQIGVNPATNLVYVTRVGDLLIIDGVTNEALESISGAGGSGAAVNPATSTIYVAGAGKDRVIDDVVVVDGASRMVKATIPTGVITAWVNAVGVNPNTNRVYVPTQNGIAVIDGATNVVMATIPVDGYLSALAVSPSTNRIYTIGRYHRYDAMIVVDAATSRVVGNLRLPYQAEHPHIAVDPNTERVYLSGEESVVVIGERR